MRCVDYESESANAWRSGEPAESLLELSPLQRSPLPPHGTRVLHRLLNEVQWNNGNKITAPIQTQGKTGNYLFKVEPYPGGPQGRSVTMAGSKPIRLIELPLHGCPQSRFVWKKRVKPSRHRVPVRPENRSRTNPTPLHNHANRNHPYHARYDAANRLTSVIKLNARRTTYTYDATDRQTLEQLASGAKVSNTYDAASRLSEVCNLKSDSSVLSDFQFNYDAAGNRTSVLENAGDRVTWTYDSANQLTGDNRSGANAYQKAFTYDSVGNRLVQNVGGSLTTSTFDAGDQLINSVDSTGVTNYSFDGSGNQSLVVAPAGGRTTSTWGYENQVEVVKLPSGQVVTSTYNADNRRFRVIK